MTVFQQTYGDLAIGALFLLVGSDQTVYQKVSISATGYKTPLTGATPGAGSTESNSTAVIPVTGATFHF